MTSIIVISYCNKLNITSLQMALNPHSFGCVDGIDDNPIRITTSNHEEVLGTHLSSFQHNIFTLYDEV